MTPDISHSGTKAVGGGRWARATVLVTVAAALAGCEKLLEVELPSLLPQEEMLIPGNAQILVDGGRADFECALANYILAGGQMGDELERRGGGSVNQGYDRRDYISSDPWYAIFPCERGTGSQQANSVYAPLQTARFNNKRTKELLRDEWTDAQVARRTEYIAQTATFEAYSVLLLGEGMCSAAVDLGPELFQEDLWRLAETKFGEAIEAATDASRNDLLALARVGRARARVNLGDFEGARADAMQVPLNFRYEARYSAAHVRTENFVYLLNNQQRSVSIGPIYQDVRFEGVPDPRVRVRDDGPIIPGHPDHVWVQENFPSLSAPIPFATWEEATLVIAEAELRAGNVTEAVSRINELHARAGLPAFASSDADEVMEHLIRERRMQLFLRGHHLQDRNRFELPLMPPPGTPHREGGFLYGTNRCLPLPDIERENNPNI